MSTTITLFLDFDGVLHPDHSPPAQLLCRLDLFEPWIRQQPAQLEVVISSTWRQKHTFDALRGMFAPDVGTRMVGVTPPFHHIDDVPYEIYPFPREVECLEWLRVHRTPSSRWLALDDGERLFRPFCENLVLTDPQSGLLPSDLQKASRWIERMASSA